MDKVLEKLEALMERLVVIETKLDAQNSLRRQFGVVSLKGASDALQMSPGAFFRWRDRNRVGKCTNGQVLMRDIVRGLERDAEARA